MDATLMDPNIGGLGAKTIRFEDADESHYRVTVNSAQGTIILTISKDEVKWIVEASEQEGK